MRVTDWRRWQRAKTAVVIALWFIGVACAGGLESEGVEPMPSAIGAVTALSFAALLLYNIIQNDRQGRK